MGKRLSLFALLALMVLGAAAALVPRVQPGLELDRMLRRLPFAGRALLQIRAPDANQLLREGAVQVLVTFPDEAHVLPETFRCLLNDVDVTDRLTLGQNGAGGEIYGLMEGENRLRFEVFGQGRWSRQYLEDVREVRVRVASPPGLDRA